MAWRGALPPPTHPLPPPLRASPALCRMRTSRTPLRASRCRCRRPAAPDRLLCVDACCPAHLAAGSTHSAALYPNLSREFFAAFAFAFCLSPAAALPPPTLDRQRLIL